jgi:hypothetical protein
MVREQPIYSRLEMAAGDGRIQANIIAKEHFATLENAK